MKQFLPAIGIIIVVALTLVSGVVQGRMSNRWGPSPDSAAAARKLEDLPRKLGSWQLQASQELSETAQDQLQCAGSVVRTYADQEAGDIVTVAVLLGPPGPISVHVPEICFSSRNHTLLEERQRVAVPNSQGSREEFWAVTFQSNDLDGGLVRVYYAWSTGGPWSAPKEPRFAFANSPYLYKIQLASNVPSGTDLKKNDPCKEFLQEFLREIKQCLVEPASG